MGREDKNFILENPDVIIGMIPVIGDLYDAVSGLIGVDPLTGRRLSNAEIGLALGVGLLGLFTGADELMDGLALLGRAANKLSPAKLVGKGLDIADKGLGALKTGAKALRDIGQAGLSQADELAQTVSRFGRNAGQVADEVAAAAVDAGRLADNADEAALSLSRMDELMGERRVFSQAETRAAFSGGSDGTLSNRLNPGCPGNSFTAGTPVETDEGQKPIEEVKVGDKVLAEDPETGEQGYFEVVALTNHPTDEILKVTLDASAEGSDNEDDAQLNTKTDDDQPTKRLTDQPATMEITPDHPVYVEDKGWLWAENLAVGDRLRRSDGGFAKVLAVERVKLAEPELVYNFTVKGPHTYFVLEVGVLVHNPSVCGPDGLGLLERYKRSRWQSKGFDVNNPKFQQILEEKFYPEDAFKLADDLGLSRKPTDLDEVFLLQDVSKSELPPSIQRNLISNLNKEVPTPKGNGT